MPNNKKRRMCLNRQTFCLQGRLKRMTENTDTPNRNSRTSDWPTLYGIQSLCHKKTVNALSLSYQSFFILFLVFLCKKILGYGGEQLVDYGSDKVAKFHITEPETIMDGVQKILKTMFHILFSISGTSKILDMLVNRSDKLRHFIES